MPKITTDELIQYLYQESSKDQSMAIEKALQTDWELKDELEILKDSMKSLDKMVKSPRSQSVDAILNYARSTMEVEQP
jgi:hypothetical protein